MRFGRTQEDAKDRAVFSVGVSIFNLLAFLIRFKIFIFKKDDQQISKTIHLVFKSCVKFPRNRINLKQKCKNLAFQKYAIKYESLANY